MSFTVDIPEGERLFEIAEHVDPKTGAKGRCMKATRDIDGSEPHILVELPFAHAPLSTDYCDTTLAKKGKDLSLCAGCGCVAYSGAPSQKIAWKKWHKAECKGLGALRKEQGHTANPTLLLTFRALVACKGDPHHPRLTVLAEHAASLDQEKRDIYAQMVVMLNSMLQRCGFDPVSLQDGITLFARLQCNTFTTVDTVLQSTGHAVYDLASAANHSCAPNMVVSFSGRTLYYLPIADIKKGDELTISYVELASLTADRSQELKERYGFDCVCTRCVDTGKALEEEFDPKVLVDGNDSIDSMIGKEDYKGALNQCLELLPYMALYNVDMHPSVGIHWLNVARLKWRLEDAAGAYEAGMIAISILKQTMSPGSQILQEAATLTADAHQLKMSTPYVIE
eukprot:TRINITY_DN11676_c0_g1_i1.p1 TRINITY_DN11676_c0_g1~~TRINITY_DN11676_c0_g1_i1.p1  ORF type:complete len:412 (+),score=200.73 TRINITY_DN11676_c0_g1_i1:50-1237(+)